MLKKSEEPLPPGEGGEKRTEKQSEERSREKMEALSPKGQEVEEKAESLSSPISKSEERKNAINQLFREEIDAQSVSIASVREKIQLDPTLCTKMLRRCMTKYGPCGGTNLKRRMWQWQYPCHRKRKQLLTVLAECSLNPALLKILKTVLLPLTSFHLRKLLQGQSQACLVPSKSKLCFIYSNIWSMGPLSQSHWLNKDCRTKAKERWKRAGEKGVWGNLTQVWFVRTSWVK